MNETTATADCAWIKLDLLARGVEIDSSVSDFAASKKQIALRNNVYNTPLWLDASRPIPQELRVSGLVVGLNSYGASPWRLSWNSKTDALILQHKLAGLTVPAEGIPDLDLFSNDTDAREIANLYGGAALAFFSPRSCYFFGDGTECHFCSLSGTAEETPGFKAILSSDEVEETVSRALRSDRKKIEQIMVVGGNMRDLDRGFKHHVALGIAAARAVRRHGLSGEISIHIATMPPRDLELIHSLSEIDNLHVMFNLEVWDASTFAQICPGKARDYGRERMLTALCRLRDVVGPYRGHSLLVTGLEPPDTVAAGARALCEMGISPIINVYHSDRHSRLGLGSRPGFDQISKVARSLQGLYAEYPVRPYWNNCGRNAIDAEAARGLFSGEVPRFLTSTDC